MLECQLVNSTYICFEPQGWHWSNPDVIGLVVGAAALGIAIGIFFFQRKIDSDIHGYVTEQNEIQESIRNAALQSIVYRLKRAEHEIYFIRSSAEEDEYGDDDQLARLDELLGAGTVSSHSDAIRQQLTLLTPYINAEFRSTIESIVRSIEDIMKPYDLIETEYDEESGEPEPPPDSMMVIEAWDSSVNDISIKMQSLIKRIEKKDYWKQEIKPS